MGIMRWLQRKGAAGGVARWALKGHQLLKTQDPGLSEEQIAERLFQLRYETLPAAGKEVERYRKLLASGRKPEDLLNVCVLIAEVEFDVTPADGQVYLDTMDAMHTELLEKGYRRYQG